MRPALWQPAIAPSPAEASVMRRIRRAQLFIFLRSHRHVIFDAAFQEELATLFDDRAKGHPPMAPALLALVTLLQAYTRASASEAVEAAVMDRRWQRCWTAWTARTRHSARARWWPSGSG